MIKKERFSDLPNIDYNSPDVYETLDSDRILPPLSLTSLNKSGKDGPYFPKGTHTIGDDDIDIDENAVQNQSDNDDDMYTANIVFRRNNMGKARHFFQKHVVEADGANFSDEFQAKNKLGSGYRVYHLINDNQMYPELCSTVAYSSQNDCIGRLQAIKSELEAIASFIAADSENGAAPLHELCRTADDKTESLLKQLSAKRSREADAESVYNELASITEQMRHWPSGLEPHSSSEALGTAVTPQNSNGVILADLDERLAQLERCLGQSSLKSNARSSATDSYKSIDEQLCQLEQQMHILLQPDETKRIAAQLSVLTADLAKALDLKRNLDLFDKTSSAAQDVAGNLTAEKIDQLYELKTAVEPVLGSLPHILARLTALKQLYFESSAVADAVAVQKQLADENKERLELLTQSLLNVQTAMAANLEKSQLNMDTIHSCILNLEKNI